MSKTVELIVLRKSEFSKLSEQILAFYKPKYKHPFTSDTIENSAILCLAQEGEKIVGAVRAISDMTRHAMIVDMVVEENYRKQKIGTRLLRSIVEELKGHNVKNIGLTTEPGISWLTEFYIKNGFGPLREGNAYLELKS
jgi:GNAT superfamily N-acetyltransferase